MRIAIASSGLGHVARGIESWAADLAAALLAGGHEVKLFKGGGESHGDHECVLGCWQRDGQIARSLHRWLPKRCLWRFGFGSTYAIEQLTFAVRLARALRQWRADIVHVQDPLVALFLQRARRLAAVPTRVILAHGTEEPAEFLNKIDYLQHLAPWHLEDARQQGCWKPTWTAIPNFIDIERFRPGSSDSLRSALSIPKDGLVILSCAAIKRKHKRVDYLIDEFFRARLDRPDLPLWLVVAGGSSEDTESLRHEAARRLGDRVRFLVNFPRERMPELYRAADLFALCSLKEMMPIALLEATASALPCLFHHHPVMEWMAGPGGSALDLRRSSALSEAVCILADRPAERAERGERSRRHCVEQFAPERVVEQIVAYYRQIHQSHIDDAIQPSIHMQVPCATRRSA